MEIICYIICCLLLVGLVRVERLAMKNDKMAKRMRAEGKYVPYWDIECQGVEHKGWNTSRPIF